MRRKTAKSEKPAVHELAGRLTSTVSDISALKPSVLVSLSAS